MVCIKCLARTDPHEDHLEVSHEYIMFLLEDLAEKLE